MGLVVGTQKHPWTFDTPSSQGLTSPRGYLIIPWQKSDGVTLRPNLLKGMMQYKVLRASPNIIFREIAGELILIPIHKRAGEEDSIYVLNETGARIWELVNGRRTLAEIISMITSEYDIDAETVAADVFDYTSEMVASGVLEEI